MDYLESDLFFVRVDDGEDSMYMMVDSGRERAVELYNSLCSKLELSPSILGMKSIEARMTICEPRMPVRTSRCIG